MGKWNFVLICLALLFIFPVFAHADDLNYDVLVRGFYWAAQTVTASTPSVSSNGYGAMVDVRFKPSSGMGNWGFTGEFTSTPNGPRFVNTGGNFSTSFNGQTGTAVPLGGGAFGLVVPGTFQVGGIKAKYFFPTSMKNFNVAVYGDYFTVTGGRNAIGGGAEGWWDFGTSGFTANGFVDWNNVTGNSFPTQTLVRYQGTIGYNIPQSSLQIFAGYRGYNFSGFYNTFINGFLAGVGSHF